MITQDERQAETLPDFEPPAGSGPERFSVFGRVSRFFDK
jgi:hypothetical protein